MRVLVTGANGFVGSAVVARAADRGFTVRGAVRRDASLPAGVERAQVGDLDDATAWEQAVAGVDVVVHAAARVHVMRETASDPLADFRRVNTAGTLHLARKAAEYGVRRLVFVSTIKVNGESTEPGRPFTSEDRPSPADAYAVSKHEAELGLFDISARSALEVVVVRPVLVYGPGVRGNFLSMLRWVSRGTPLPIGAIRNKRSFVAVDNLADLLLQCAVHPGAVGSTFLVSDGDDISTAALAGRIGDALGRPARLISVPVALLRAGGLLSGRSESVRRLCDSLQVDMSRTRRLLGWTPPVSMQAALGATARRFLAGPGA
jgi:nucleoside-diphosphate-sugar epimerase